MIQTQRITTIAILLSLILTAAFGCEGLFKDLDDLGPPAPPPGPPCEEDAPHFSGGDGTDEDPYRICTTEDFLAIDSEPEFMEAHYILLRDLDFIDSPPFTRWAGLISP